MSDESVKKEYVYRMATKAYHLMGDISRDTPSLCVVKPALVRITENADETFSLVGWSTRPPDGDYYVGQWVEGFGFVQVLFPADTTRELTEDEIQYYERGYYQLADHEPRRMNIRDHV